MLTEEQLMDSAREARMKAHAYESGYSVGAALQTDKGVFTGANIEVSGRTTSVHAEMLAMFKAVMDGANEFHTLAVAPDGQTGEAICGLCQHTVSQFVDDDDLLILEDIGSDTEFERYNLATLIGPAYSPSTRDRSTDT